MTRALVAASLMCALVAGCGGGDDDDGGSGGSSGPPGTLELSATAFQGAEGITLEITVSRSGGSAGAVSVAYATANGTAIAGSDYAATSGTLSWPDGLLGSRTIRIPLTADDDVEPDETFTLSLSNVSRATLGPNAVATVTLVDTGNTRLSKLDISAAPLDQIFQPTLLDYTATASLLRSTTTITAVAEDPRSVVRIDGVELHEDESPKLTLEEGANTFTVEVTAVDGVRTAAYTVAVTRSSALAFGQRAYIKASNADAGDAFHLVAIDGDTLAIGADFEDSGAAGIDGDQSDNSAEDAGAMYVYARDPSGAWAQEAYLKASNPEGTDIDDPIFGDRFGSALALSGNTLVVGARFESGGSPGINGDQSDNSAEHSGAVYVFERDSLGVWSQTAYIKASNPDPSDGFGANVAIDGDTLVVVAVNEASGAAGVNGDQTDNSVPFAGAVYVFTRDDRGDWAQQAYIKPSKLQPRTDFGSSVAIDGDTLVVGAYQEDGIADNTGAAYVFTRDAAGVWSEQARLETSNLEEDDGFGFAVAVDGDTLAVSAVFEDGGSPGVNGDETDNSVLGSGAVYVFTRDTAGVWTQQAYIKTEHPGLADQLGLGQIALGGDLLVVGAHAGEDSGATGVNGDQTDNSAPDSGAVYAFTRDAAGVWSQTAYLKASNTEAGDRFGWGLAVDFGTATIVVGADNEDSSARGIDGNQADNSLVNSGAVYVFQ